jgi:hypothetical protein
MTVEKDREQNSNVLKGFLYWFKFHLNRLKHFVYAFAELAKSPALILVGSSEFQNEFQ